MAKKKDPDFRVVAENRKARYLYAIESTIEAGLVLTGSEVKSLRTGKATIAESYATAKDGELYLVNSYIPEYLMANRFNHEPRRTRKLLVRKTEARKLAVAIQREAIAENVDHQRAARHRQRARRVRGHHHVDQKRFP